MTSSPPLHPRRLDKFLADARVGSRRHIEALAEDGAIHLNGHVVHGIQSLRKLIDPTQDVVDVAGTRAILSPPRIYALLHKPAGVVTTLADPKGRGCIAELIPKAWVGRAGVVGRLDKPTTGALLVTDDGDLSHLLTDPEFHVWKRYLLTVRGTPKENDPRLRLLRDGVTLGQKQTKPARCGVVPNSDRIGRYDRPVTDVWIELREGRFRQVRKMASRVQFKLTHLHRTAIGPLRLGALEEGKWRSLDLDEIDALYMAAGGRDAPRVGARRALVRRLEAGELDDGDASLVRRWLAKTSDPR